MGLLSKTLLAEAVLPEDADSKSRFSQKQIQGLTSLTEVVNTLYCKPRRTWVVRGVENPESVAEHSEDMARMSLFLAPGYPQPVQPFHAAFMALTHDLIEGPRLGDETITLAKFSPDEKRKREHQALEYITSLPLPNGLARKIDNVWREFDDNQTPCAQFVKQLGKLQMAHMALHYEREQGLNMPDVWNCAERAMTAPNMKYAFNELRGQRPKSFSERPVTLAQELTPEMESTALARAEQRYRERTAPLPDRQFA